MSPQELNNLFSYHRPSEENVDKIRSLRKAHLELGKLILDLTPGCAEQTLAIRALHQCSMHANYALVKDDPKAE